MFSQKLAIKNMDPIDIQKDNPTFVVLCNCLRLRNKCCIRLLVRIYKSKNTMSNLPLGAENDPFAPYNVQEETFKFDLGVKGIAWYEYYGYLDIDEAKETIKQRLTAALSQLGDIDINDVDIAIY